MGKTSKGQTRKVTSKSRRIITRKEPKTNYKECAVVTGASSGIGKALVLHLAQKCPQLQIVGLARTATCLRSELSLPNIMLIDVDLASESSRTQLVKKLKNKKLRYLVNVAANMDNNGWDSLTHQTLIDTLQLITIAPLMLARELKLSPFSPRILNLGSKGCHEYKFHAPAFCIAKAGLVQVNRMINEECSDLISTIAFPGVVDTPMLAQVFRALSNTNKVLTPELVAVFLSYLLCDTTEQEYKSNEWNIYDTSHHKEWVPKGKKVPPPPTH